MRSPATKVSAVRVTGPLAPFAANVKERLLASGDTPLTTANLGRCLCWGFASPTSSRTAGRAWGRLNRGPCARPGQ
jgi:hypothetical protein